MYWQSSVITSITSVYGTCDGLSDRTKRGRLKEEVCSGIKWVIRTHLSIATTTTICWRISYFVVAQFSQQNLNFKIKLWIKHVLQYNIYIYQTARSRFIIMRSRQSSLMTLLPPVLQLEKQPNLRMHSDRLEASRCSGFNVFLDLASSSSFATACSGTGAGFPPVSSLLLMVRWWWSWKLWIASWYVFPTTITSVMMAPSQVATERLPKEIPRPSLNVMITTPAM